MVKIKFNDKTLHVSRDLDIDGLVVSKERITRRPLDRSRLKVYVYITVLNIPLKNGEIYKHNCYHNGVDKDREIVREAFSLGLQRSNKKKDLAKRVDILECHVNALLEASQL